MITSDDITLRFTSYTVVLYPEYVWLSRSGYGKGEKSDFPILLVLRSQFLVLSV